MKLLKFIAFYLIIFFAIGFISSYLPHFFETIFTWLFGVMAFPASLIEHLIPAKNIILLPIMFLVQIAFITLLFRISFSNKFPIYIKSSMLLLYLIICKFWVGVYEHDEFYSHASFVKHRPIWKTHFHSPISMSDIMFDELSNIQKEEQLLFNEFVSNQGLSQ